MKKPWFSAQPHYLFIHKPLTWQGWLLTIVLSGAALGWVEASITDVQHSYNTAVTSIAGVALIALLYYLSIQYTKATQEND